jgi:hypothetical protein
MRPREPAAVSGSGEAQPSERSRTAGSSWTTKGKIGSNDRSRAVARTHCPWFNRILSWEPAGCSPGQRTLMAASTRVRRDLPTGWAGRGCEARFPMAWSCITYVASMPAGIRTTFWLSPMRRTWPSRLSLIANAGIRYPVPIFGSTRGQAHGSAEHAMRPTSEPIANAKLRRDDIPLPCVPHKVRYVNCPQPLCCQWTTISVPTCRASRPCLGERRVLSVGCAGLCQSNAPSSVSTARGPAVG